MLYTTYLVNARKIPQGVRKYLIVRYSPKGFQNGKGFIHRPDLSPSKGLLLRYKSDDDWKRYVKQFEWEMENRQDLKKAVEELSTELQKGEDICLVCYEKDYSHCHRYLIAQKLMQKGIEWKEL